MSWVEYHIELITHCICAGADQTKAEMRIPSIRGQARWWFRALGGSGVEEKTLFGGVHGDAEKSKVVLRLQSPLSSNEAFNLHDLVGTDQNHPQAYLLWPLRPTRASQQKRGMISPGQSFILSYRVSAKFSNPVLVQKLQGALEAWIILGAIGTRSRRGYGSIGPLNEPYSGSGGSVTLLKQRLRETLSTFGHPKLKVMLLSGPQDSSDVALDRLGEWLKNYRAGSTKSVKSPKAWGLNDHAAGLGKANKVYRPVLGLPLTQRYGSSKIDTKIGDNDRWASPIHLKVTKCGNKFYPMAVFFPEMAIPEGTNINLSKTGGESWKVRLDHALLKEMMTPGNNATVLWEP